MTQTVEETRNADAFRAIIERIINDGEVDLCETYMHPDMQIRRFGLAGMAGLLGGGPRGGVEQAGAIDSFKGGLAALRSAFPDWTHTIEHLVAKDDWVSGRWVLNCTHNGGPFMGVEPAGGAINVVESGMIRFEDGRMIEGWFLTDELTFARQLGADIRFDQS